jgi:hypothetical protein
MRTAKPEFIQLAKSLPEEAKKRILSRMKGKLPTKISNEKLSELEALAVQLEIEDENLQEWMSKVRMLRERDNHPSKKSSEKKNKK